MVDGSLVRPVPRQRLWPLLVIFVAITLITLALTLSAIAGQSSVRGFVAGEANWSKGQRDAVEWLERYATTRRAEWFAAYQEAIAIPLGDRIAHIELEKTYFDSSVAADGFARGGVHVDDIPGMILLYRCCGRMEVFRPALVQWTRGDELVIRLEQAGLALRREIESSSPSAEAIAGWVEEIRSIDSEVRPLADSFSRAMGDAARSVTKLLVAGTCGTIVICWLLGGLVAARFLRKSGDAAREYQTKLKLLASRDTLTGLANRAAFEQRCRLALAEAIERNRTPSLLFIDLDGFKAINDTYGHLEGDSLLCSVASRIRSTIRNQDLIARVGGDEFAVLIDGDESRDCALQVARKLLAELVDPIPLADQVVRVSASIGVATFPEHGRDYASLLSHADMAMYEAKRLGRNNFQAFRPEMAELSSSRLRLANGLRQAIDKGQLRMFYQPCVDLVTGEIVSLEALLRWTHPELGAVPPSLFIPLAEEIGMIDPITDWVLQEVCQQGVEWQRQGLRPPIIAMNMSQHCFWDPELPKRIADTLERTGWPAQRLCVEITETTITSQSSPELIMQRLKDIGLHLAIDDFGIGYSSLANLKLFPVDCLKIDRAFTQEIPGKEEDVAFVRTIVGLARSLSLKVIAEGIETAAQHEALLEAGCAFGQGYLFGRPVDADSTARLLVRPLALALPPASTPAPASAPASAPTAAAA